MKTNYAYFIGVDISKEHLDFAIYHKGKVHYHKSVSNQTKDIESYLEKELSQEIDLRETLFCMENTGIYTQLLLHVLTVNSCSVWLEHAMQIKQSMGVTRGKDDKIDAQRIARYAARFADKVCLYTPIWKASKPYKPFVLGWSRFKNNSKHLLKKVNVL